MAKEDRIMSNEYNNTTCNLSESDVLLLANYGFYIDTSLQKRDEEDVVFATSEYILRDQRNYESEGSFAEEFVQKCKGLCFFEPKCVGRANDNWNVGIVDLSDGTFLSYDGTWPDCFLTAQDAMDCYETYFAEKGLLELKRLKATI